MKDEFTYIHSSLLESGFCIIYYHALIDDNIPGFSRANVGQTDFIMGFVSAKSRPPQRVICRPSRSPIVDRFSAIKADGSLL